MSPNKISPDDVQCECAGEADPIEYDAIKHMTDRAVLLVIYGDDEWIPKSCIAEINKDEVWIATWLIKEKGWN